mgnify:CR=1 FL=1
MQDEFNDPLWRQVVSGAQMLFVAFGALVLMPLITGLDPNVALFTAGSALCAAAGSIEMLIAFRVLHKMPGLGEDVCSAAKKIAEAPQPRAG